MWQMVCRAYTAVNSIVAISLIEADTQPSSLETESGEISEKPGEFEGERV